MKTSIVQILEEKFLGKKITLTFEFYIGREKKTTIKTGVVTLVKYHYGEYGVNDIVFGFDDEHDESALMTVDPDSDIEILD